MIERSQDNFLFFSLLQPYIFFLIFYEVHQCYNHDLVFFLLDEKRKIHVKIIANAWHLA